MAHGFGPRHDRHMDQRSKPHPAYVLHCLEELLDVLCEADELARAGRLDGRFADTLRYAGDLLHILTDEVGTQPELLEAEQRVKTAAAVPARSPIVH